MAEFCVAERVRIGDFELDLDSGELVRDGTRVRLQVQSLELLKALLERPGKMVGREELRQRLWPEDTFVDFDHGLNAAVRRLREALGDSADAPRFVETIPRKGYRLVADTDVAATAPLRGAALPDHSRSDRPARRPHIHVPRAMIPWIVTLVVVGTAAWMVHGRTDHVAGSPRITLSLDVPVGWEMGTWDRVALSPDSRHIAFTATGPARQRGLWLRPLSDGAAHLVPRTVGAFAPFWSPDSGKVGFFAQSTLQVVTVADGTVQAITTIDAPELLGGAATWMANGDILLSPVTTSSGAIVNSRGLYRLSTQTGRLDLVPSLGRPPQLAYLWPSAVPGSDRFTFLSWHREKFDMTGHTATLQPGNNVTDIGQAESHIVATTSGHLVFVRNGALLAQRFATDGRAAGQPMVLARDVSVELPTLGLFSASSDVVVYLTRAMVPAEMEMSVRDDNGTKQGVLGGRGIYSGLAASPDGTRIAVSPPRSAHRHARHLDPRPQRQASSTADVRRA